MTESINWLARDVYKHLTRYHRGDLLMLLNLHTNTRNRCWPSIETLAEEMDLSPTTIIKAKRWLIEVGALTLVSVDKREGKELKLPVAQHIYQLTGFFVIDGVVTPYFSKDPSTFDYNEFDFPESVRLIFQNLEYPESGSKVIPVIENKVIPDSLVPLASQESPEAPCETPKPQPAKAGKPKAAKKPKAQPDPDKPRLVKDERYHELVNAVKTMLFNGSNGKGFIQGRDVAMLWHKGYTAEKLGQFVEWWDAEHNTDPRKPRVYLPQAPETLEHWLYMFTQSAYSDAMETQHDPRCPKCGGSGYVVGKDEDGNEIARPCGYSNQNS